MDKKEPIKIYHYTPETGEFLGEGLSDICPISGSNLIPAFATEIAPPEILEGKKAVFVSSSWELCDIPKVVENKEPDPTPEQVKQQKISALDGEYRPQFTALADSLGLATLDGNQTVIDEIKANYATLKAEYQTKLEAINNGN